VQAHAETQLREIAARFLTEVDPLAEEMFSRIRAHAAEWEEADVPALWDILFASCVANIRTGMERLARDRSVPSDFPPDASELARVSARLDVPLTALLRTYRIGYALMSERWYQAVEAAPLSSEERVEVVEAAFSYLFEYVDRVSSFVTDIYTAERDHYLRSREQRRAQLVRAVLDGEDVDLAEARSTLDYDLTLEHVAAVIAGPHPQGAVAELAAALEAPHRLILPVTAELAWVWVGRTRPFEDLRRLLPPDGAMVALGDPGTGLEGFRRSHRQARDAHRVMAGSDRPLTHYGDVALEALVTEDEQRVRDFVERELRGLGEADARSEVLRETLRAYFAAEQNASAAAAALGVHEHTVSYRLRTIEERLGCHVASRRGELEAALRMRLVLEAQSARVK
jgi:hypothetical protein